MPSMYIKDVVLEKPKGVKLCPVGKNVYVYYVLETVYLPEKKYNKDKRVCIGKMVPNSNTKMIPNDRFEEFFPDLLMAAEKLPEPPKFSLTLHVGAVVAQRQIARNIGLWNILLKIYGLNIAQEILSVISFVLTEESAVFQYYPDFMKNHLPENINLRSDSYVSTRLLHHEITGDRITQMLCQWNDLHIDSGMVYIGCDSTNFNTEAEDISLAEFGSAKDDRTKPQVNLAVALNQADSTPLHYDLFPGSIVDVTECEQLINQLLLYGYKNVGLLFDRGYFSEPNIRELDSLDFDFMMMLREDLTFFKALVKKHLDEVKDHPDVYINGENVYGITVSEPLFDKTRYFHIYYDEVKAGYSKRHFLNTLTTLKSELSDLLDTVLRKNMNLSKYKAWFDLDIDKETRVLKFFTMKREKVHDRLMREGFFVIMTTRQVSAEYALHTYRGRDNIEKFFRGIKSGMDFDSPGVHDDVSLAAKIHLIFLAGIIRNQFILASQDIKKATGNTKSFTVPMMIRQLENISCTAFESGLYLRRFAFTATQKLILNALNVDPAVIDKEIMHFNDLIRKK